MDDNTQVLDDQPSECPSVKRTTSGAYLIFRKDGTKIPIENEGLVIGRAECFDHRTVSNRHFRIFLVDQRYYAIEDLSSNGSWVNGKRIAKMESLPLQDNDIIRVGLIDDASGFEFCFFLGTCNFGSSNLRKKRKLEPHPSNASTVGLADKIEDNLFCSICQDIMYRPVSLMPCLHNFCSYCVGECIKKAGPTVLCPMARCPVTGVKPNHLVASMVDAFLEHNPTKKRKEEETKFYDENDALRKANYDLNAHRGNDSDSEADSSSVHYEGRCVACGDGIEHLRDEGRCELCRGHTCGDTCAPKNPEEFLGDEPLANFDFRDAWLRNDVERDILTEILRSRGTSLSAAACSKMQQGENEEKCCEKCNIGKVEAALTKYRLEVPADELPEAVRRKEHCWWGKGCRTQVTNPAHAARLNHACEPTRHA